jgi:hypothetical protein
MQYHHIILYFSAILKHHKFFFSLLQEFCANAILCANNITGFDKVLSYMRLTLRCTNLLSAPVIPLSLVVWAEIYISSKRILL